MFVMFDEFLIFFSIIPNSLLATLSDRTISTADETSFQCGRMSVFYGMKLK